MSFSPAAHGEPELTMAGGWEKAWILVWIFLEMEQEMIVCLSPSQEPPCPCLPNLAWVCLHTEEDLLSK